MKYKFILLALLIGGVFYTTHAVTPQDSALYHPYWKLGQLDPVRNIQWPQSIVYEDKLEYVPITPKYVAYISELDHALTKANHNYFNIRPLYEPDGTLTIKPISENHAVVLFVDLGRTLPGTIEFEANPPEGVSITFETGEAQQPRHKYAANTLPDGSKKTFKPQIDHAGWAGMRFVWIRFENLKEPFTLHTLHGIYQIRPSSYIGNFACNDDVLNRVWEMCAYSAHAVMGQPVGNSPTPQPVLQTLCMDRIDRHPWAGDSRIIQKVVEYVFGEYDLLRKNNEDFVPVGQRPMPVLTTVVPYILDWALAEVDYFRISGDSAHFTKRIEDILVVMDEFDPYLNPRDGWYFFDWDLRLPKPTLTLDSKPNAQEKAAFFGKYIQMCREAAAAAKTIGKNEAAQKLQDKADNYTRKWQENNSDWLAQYDIHAMTNLILGGVLSENDFPAIYNKVYADRTTRYTQTPFFGYYVLMALTHMGRHDKTVEMIRDYWGTMIQAGATSVWEEWDPTWQLPMGALPPQYEPPMAWSGLSLIQAAGAGPAQWLLSEVIGIKPEAPGFEKIKIEPNTVDLTWAKGTVASPIGAVHAEWEIAAQTLTLNFSVPERCKSTTVALPKGKKYTLNHKKVAPDFVKDNKAYFTVTQKTNIFEVTGL
jgi:hypothetical protein